jgi:hypothetical protein
MKYFILSDLNMFIWDFQDEERFRVRVGFVIWAFIHRRMLDKAIRPKAMMIAPDARLIQIIVVESIFLRKYPVSPLSMNHQEQDQRTITITMIAAPI